VTRATPLLLVDGITAGYGRIDILHDVSLAICPGEIVSVIGPNGAGKSTAFEGPGRALLEDPEVKQLYLGG
jgi:ABC-type branched-subunit amino acid transport system ATPase component